MVNLEGKWALVTGASRGIGREVSLALAKLGCGVVLHSRRKENCEEVADEIKKLGVPHGVVAGELSDFEQLDAAIDDAVTLSGQIDILYNNAAVQTDYRQNPWTFEPNDFRKCFEVNTIGVVRVCQFLAPPMLKRGWGRIINVSSGIRDQPEMSPYAISKAALDKYVRDFAPKLAGTGVTMTLLDPGWLRTAMGGPNAPGEVSSVVPGALMPVLLDDGVSGRWCSAQDYAGMTVEAALAKAERFAAPTRS